MFDLFNRVRDIVSNRDEKRTFTRTQKNEAFDKKGGTCYRCGKQLKASTTEYHHIKAWSKNGETSIKNAAALCPNCHREIHHEERLAEIEAKSREKAEKKKADNDPYNPFGGSVFSPEAPKKKGRKKKADDVYNPFDISLSGPEAPKKKGRKKKADDVYNPFDISLSGPEAPKKKGRKKKADNDPYNPFGGSVFSPEAPKKKGRKKKGNDGFGGLFGGI